MSRSRFSNPSELFKGLRVKLIGSLFSVIALLSCQMPSLSQNCNKQNKVEFRACIVKNFPVGSNLSDLKIFLESQGFTQSQSDPKDPKNFFYFIWDANDIGNYKVTVFGIHNSDLTIKKIFVSPKTLSLQDLE